METLNEEAIRDSFPDEHLMAVQVREMVEDPWYADYANFLVSKIIPHGLIYHLRKKFLSEIKHSIWDDPYLFKSCPDGIIRRCVFGKELQEILEHCHTGPTRGCYGADISARKIFESRFYWPTIFRDAARVPKALISDCGTHFCNSLLDKTLKKYGVTHRLATPYHPQTSSQTENTNRAIKRILERNVNGNRKEWADLDTAGKHRVKRWHDAKIMDKEFNEGDEVLVFNSRLKLFPGKLKSRWYGPYTISKVFPYGTVEVCSLETLTRLHSSTWATKWFKRLVAYAKCNRDSYERETRLFYRHFARIHLLQSSFEEERNAQGSLLF
ncbi:reverse transcriptase domain-containing protein [Tanacetum coccineum]|uniref:Reverse transcriptase domain-containing protein n=1 Tax=Tanacetum coccineum TaxID=301880 RepID=A0ABQ4WQE5_9ASTR